MTSPRRASSRGAGTSAWGAFLACLIAGSLPPAYAQVRSCDIEHYEAELTVDPGHKRISGRTGIIFTATEDRCSAITLDAHAMSFSSVRIDNRRCRFTATQDSVTVVLPRTLRRGDRAKMILVHESRPTRGMNWSDSLVYTSFHTNGWLPCSMLPSDHATLRLNLRIPSALEAIATGSPVAHDTIRAAWRHWTFDLTVPSPAYTFGFILGRFKGRTTQRHGASTILTYSTQRDSIALDSIAGSMIGAVRFFTERSRLELPYPSYTQVFVPGDAQQEMAGMAALSEEYGDDLLADPREDWLSVHELAHQWWGNRITCHTWSDMWLHEGMATFMTAAFKEERWGRAEYEREMVLARWRYERARATGAEHALHFTRWRTPEEANDVYTYYKGALVLHYLRFVVGEQAFWDGLRIFSHDHVGGSVTSSDLRTAMEGASGQSLDTFFREWVISDTAPRLHATFRVASDSVVINLADAAGRPARAAMMVAVETTGGRSQHRVDGVGGIAIPVTLGDTILSVRIDQGGYLPLRVEYERPLSMLLYQAGHEPDVAGRADALLALGTMRTSLSADENDRVRSALDERLQNDTSRLIRQLAQRMRDAR